MTTAMENNGNYMQVRETVARRMAVIECHRKNETGYGWGIHEIFTDWQTEGMLAESCRKYAEGFRQSEFRYRYGTLTLDPSDRCETFKSE